MYSYVIVDDEALIRQGLRKKIEAAAPQLQFVGEADNGQEALELVERTSPQLIFTDMRMPIMDGKSLLKELQAHHPEKKVIVVSGYSDFEYMQEAISAKVTHYLLKPFSREEIRIAVEKAVQSIDFELLTRQTAQLESQEREKMGLENDQQYALNQLLGLPSSTVEPEFRSTSFRALASGYVTCLLYSSVNVPMRTSLPLAQNLIILPHPRYASLVYILLPAADLENLRSAEAFVLNYVQALRAEAHIQAYVGMSSRKSHLRLLQESSAEASAALDRKGLQDHERLLYRFAADPPTVEEPFSWNKIQDLLFFIESGDTARTIELTLSFFVYVRSLPNLSLSGFKAQCRQIISEVKRLIGMYYPLEAGHADSSSLEDVLRTSFSDEEIQQYFLTVLSSAADLMRENRTYASPHVIENVKTYINKNYRQALTLDRISELFFLNPSYLSHLFKEKTGQNLIDYVNEVRIEAARRLLAGTDDKIYRIAKSTGIQNPKYFFRLFKKLTHMTPEEYRKLHQDLHHS